MASHLTITTVLTYSEARQCIEDLMTWMVGIPDESYRKDLVTRLVDQITTWCKRERLGLEDPFCLRLLQPDATGRRTLFAGVVPHGSTAPDRFQPLCYLDGSFSFQTQERC